MLRYLILLYFLVSLSASATADNDNALVRCDYEYSQEAQGWLKLHRQPDNWYKARSICLMEGAIFASPTCKLSNTITTIMENQKLESIYIGVVNYIYHKALATVDGTQVNYRTIPHGWAVGEPDYKNHTSHCLTLDKHGKLAFVNCDKELPFFCFKKEIERENHPCGTFSKGYTYHSRTQSCHKVHHLATTFYEAYKWCYYEGGYLTIINDEAEAFIIKSMLNNCTTVAQPPDNTSYFVGFHREYDKTGDFYTLKDQLLSDAGYNKFETGEPDNKEESENCGSISTHSGRLNDISCFKTLGFVCEIDAMTKPCDCGC